MNINVTNGVRKVTLTKGERAALRKSCDVCGELQGQFPAGNDAGGSAQRAWLALGQVIDYFDPEPNDTPQSKPEAAKA
jgi:hypothetical protein